MMLNIFHFHIWNNFELISVKMNYISAFTLVPAAHRIKAIYGIKNAMQCSAFYAVLSVVVSFLITSIYVFVHFAIGKSWVNNIYMGTAVVTSVFMVVIFCADLPSIILGAFNCCYASVSCQLGMLSKNMCHPI